MKRIALFLTCQPLVWLILMGVCTVSHAGPVPPFVTIFMRGLLDDATALAGRTTLGIGEGDSPVFVGVTLSGDTFVIATNKTPATANSAGTQGQIAWNPNYIYVCVAANTWKRAAITTWFPENVIYAGENVVYAGEQVEYSP